MLLLRQNARKMGKGLWKEHYPGLISWQCVIKFNSSRDLSNDEKKIV